MYELGQWTITFSKRYLNKKLYMTKLIATVEATRFTNERTDSHDTNSTLCTCTWLINPFATPPKQEIPRCILIKRNLHAMKSTIVWMNDRESFAKNNSKVSLNGTFKSIRHRSLDQSLNILSNLFRDEIKIWFKQQLIPYKNLQRSYDLMKKNTNQIWKSKNIYRDVQ